MPTLSAKLVAEYGKEFAEKSLRRMVQFAEVFPNENMVVTLSRELSWSHFIEILPLKQPLGFTFVARQKRISVGADDFYLDLLFCHRHLKRLVAVGLKLEKFQPAHKG